MNSLEIADRLDVLRTEVRGIVETAEQEQRRLSDTEKASFDAKLLEIRQLIELKSNKNTKKSMEKREFSILEMIQNVVNNRNLDVVNEVNAEVRRSCPLNGSASYSGQIQIPAEKRAIVAGTDGQGGYAIDTETMDFIGALRDRMVLTQAGATVLAGLTGNVDMPIYSGTSVAWAGETAAAADGAGTFTHKTLTPKRLTCKLPISKQFLAQTGAWAENVLRQDLVNAVSEKLQATILGTAAASATQPGGLLNGKTEKAALTWEEVLKLEENLENANIVMGSPAFIVNPSFQTKLKGTPKAGTFPTFIMENGQVNGYPAYTTHGCAGVLFGDFAEVFVGQWGALDITVDNVTLAAEGQIQLIVNAYFDAIVRRDAAIGGYIYTA